MLAHIRTIKTAMQEIKKQDPETALTENIIRSLIKKGKICTIGDQTPYMFTMESLYDALNGDSH